MLFKCIKIVFVLPLLGTLQTNKNQFSWTQFSRLKDKSCEFIWDGQMLVIILSGSTHGKWFLSTPGLAEATTGMNQKKQHWFLGPSSSYFEALPALPLRLSYWVRGF